MARGQRWDEPASTPPPSGDVHGPGRLTEPAGFLHGIFGTAHGSSLHDELQLTASQIAAAADMVSVSVVCPDRWSSGDFAAVTGIRPQWNGHGR
jgi:hypothetical protein